MKTLIYQYWDGRPDQSVQAGSDAMNEYADRIGSDYLFEDNPLWIGDRKKFGYYAPHFGAFKPVFEPEFYEKYDKIMFVDTDVFPVNNLLVNCFDQFDADIGICIEPGEPERRKETLGKITHDTDEHWAKTVENKWGKKMPRNENGLLKVYNTGMVMYSQPGMEIARKSWMNFVAYAEMIRTAGMTNSFYWCDQPYLHAMMFACEMNVQEIDPHWNCIITGSRLKSRPERHLIDNRDGNEKFVHAMFPGADGMSSDNLWKIVNEPFDKWPPVGLSI